MHAMPDVALDLAMPIVGNYVATLVMSFAIGYQDPELFYIFVGTLRASGYAGDVVLVVGERVPSVARKFCEAHNVSLLPRAMINMANSSASHGLMHPQFQRFAIYPDLCQSRYDACFATDFRDVYFQADPFATLQAAPNGTRGWLVGSIEHANTDVATDVVNANWVSVCYGRGSRELKAMRKKPIVCSGVLFGNAAAFSALAHGYAHTTCREARDGIDQGVLNALIHAPSQRKLLGAVHITLQLPGAGNVISLSAYKMHVRKLPVLDGGGVQGGDHAGTWPITYAAPGRRRAGGDKNHSVINTGWPITFAEGSLRRRDTGAPVAVIHQYDRLVFSPWGPSLRFATLERFKRVPCVAAGRPLRHAPWNERTAVPPSYGTAHFRGGIIKAICSMDEVLAKLQAEHGGGAGAPRAITGSVEASKVQAHLT
jgi:hypothetical protein